MNAAVIQMLTGNRLHLHHGPMDVVIKADGAPDAVAHALKAAIDCFTPLLTDLVRELPALRQPVSANGPSFRHPVAERMQRATRKFLPAFLTPMAAVAGSVADELMAAMRRAAPLTRAYVNDGGDIAVHIAPGETLDIAMAGNFSGGPIPAINGQIHLDAASGIGGIATSGARGRSFSLGIADSVTVLAENAATADAAATLIANAVNLDDPAISREPATAIDPDSDLGDRPVTRHVGPLSRPKIRAALANGEAVAMEMIRAGLIHSAALSLQNQTITAGTLPALHYERASA